MLPNGLAGIVCGRKLSRGKDPQVRLYSRRLSPGRGRAPQAVCDADGHHCLAIFWLTHINRQTPEAPCTTILAQHEWQALYTAIHRSATLPATPPTVRQAVRWIAQLGGFSGRKGDGEPGITTLWRGWSRLADMADLYLITHPSEDTGNS